MKHDVFRGLIFTHSIEAHSNTRSLQPLFYLSSSVYPAGHLNTACATGIHTPIQSAQTQVTSLQYCAQILLPLAPIIAHS